MGKGKRVIGKKGKVARFVDKRLRLVDNLRLRLVDNFLQECKKFWVEHFSLMVKMLDGSCSLPCASGELGKGVQVSRALPCSGLIPVESF